MQHGSELRIFTRRYGLLRGKRIIFFNNKAKKRLDICHTI
jgi:hypothetical protein